LAGNGITFTYTVCATIAETTTAGVEQFEGAAIGHDIVVVKRE